MDTRIGVIFRPDFRPDGLRGELAGMAEFIAATGDVRSALCSGPLSE